MSQAIIMIYINVTSFVLISQIKEEQWYVFIVLTLTWLMYVSTVSCQHDVEVGVVLCVKLGATISPY